MVLGPFPPAGPEGFWYFRGSSLHRRNGIMEDTCSIQKLPRVYYHLHIKFNRAALIIQQTELNCVNSLRFRL